MQQGPFLRQQVSLITKPLPMGNMTKNPVSGADSRSTLRARVHRIYLPAPVDTLAETGLKIELLSQSVLRIHGTFLRTVNCQPILSEDDPLSAVVEIRQSQSILRDAWRTRIETLTRMSCTRDAFKLRASMRAHEDDIEICRREWDRSVPRCLV